MWTRVKSPLQRVVYYTVALLRELVPQPLWHWHWQRQLDAVTRKGVSAEVIQRVNYYNKLTPGASIEGAPLSKNLAFRPTYYYFDLREYACAFPASFRLAHRFGDVTEVPAMPSIIKSRPIAEENAAAVLMKLDRLRHFRWPNDPFRFEEKKPVAIWRGTMNNPARERIVGLYASDRRFDIGQTGEGFEGIPAKPHVSIREHMRCRYIISLEGRDVATNLKWIMASNSLCLMPRPRYETWFMEGLLEPGVHYAELCDDLSNLPDLVEHFERHPEEARSIIRAANAHAARFANHRREHLISMLVLQKYFECTGQIFPREVAELVS